MVAPYRYKRGFPMNWLVNENNFLHVGLMRIWDIVLANLLFILCSLPLVTIGPALTALHHCTLRMVKGNNEGTFKTFFRAFRQNFRQSITVWLLTVAAAAVLYSNILFLWETPGAAANIFLYVMVIFALFLIFVSLYVYPVIAAFEGTIAMHVKNAFMFAAKSFVRTIAMFLIWTFCLATTIVDVGLQPLYVFCWFFFLFALIAYINSRMLYKMFKPYLPREEGEEVWVDTDDQAYLP